MFTRNVSLCNYDIIIITETWLSDNVNNAELGLSPRYTIFRCDRCNTRDVTTRGGGVLIAVKNQFSCRRLPISDNSVEQLFIQISEKSLSLVIGAVYIPPASDINVYDIHFNAIDVLLNNNCHSKFLIFGDYNLPKISWQSVNGSIVASGARAGSLESDVLAQLSYLNLMQFNLIYNRSGSLLDLIFSNVFDINVINDNHTLLPLDSMYHPALSVELPILPFKYLEYNEQMYDFVNCDYNSIRSNLASLDWNGIFNGLDINDTVNIFYENIFKIINAYCPIKTVYLTKHPHWFSSSLKKLILDKKIAHKTYKQSPNSYNYNKFSNLRACCKAQNKIDYNIFIQKTQNSITSNPKLFWKYVNSKRSTLSLPNSMYYNNENISGGNDITNCFAQHFSSVLNMPSITESIVDYYNTSIPSVDLNSCTLAISDVYNELNEIKYSTCSGPENISNTFFMQCKFVLSTPLLMIFNRSLAIGVFPDQWKISYVSPVYKSGDINNIINYRPVSIISIIPKIFEGIVYKKISPLFKNFIVNEQHGFMSGRSTTTNLLVLQHFILNAFKSNCQVDVIYTDFAKAFDKIDHNILIKKLFQSGLRNPFYSWLVSFLSGRKQYVKFKNYNSYIYNVTSGVPQGSHLAPLLFNIYINDISNINSNILLFADDAKFFRIIKSPLDSNLLQYDLDNISNWCDNNKLYLNVSKCKIITFTRKRVSILNKYFLNGIELERVNLIKDLGVYLDSSLSFNDHHVHIQNRASSMLGFIMRSCNNFNNLLALKSLYCALVRSIFDYNSIIWSPYTLGPIYSIEAIQNRFLRIISIKCNIKRLPHTSYEPLLLYLNIDTLQNRRIKNDISFIFKLLNGYIYCPDLLSNISFLVPGHSTRQTDTFYMPFQRTLYGKNAPLFRCMQHVNNYNVDLFICYSVSSFYLYLRNLFT